MSWRPVTDIDASFDRLRQLKEQMKGHNDAAEARLKASEDRVEKLLKENAELRKKMTGGRYFTADQLKQYEAAIRADEFKRKEKALEAEMWRLREQHIKEVEEYFAKLREFLIADCPQEQFINWASLYLQLLIETMDKEFHWKMPPNQNYADKNYKISRLIKSIMEKFNEIAEDDDMDIRIAAEQAAEKYKIYFRFTEE